MKSIVLGRFVFGIKTVFNPEGKLEEFSHSVSTGLSKEVIIQRMRAFLTQLEKEYPPLFDKSHDRFEK